MRKLERVVVVGNTSSAAQWVRLLSKRVDSVLVAPTRYPIEQTVQSLVSLSEEPRRGCLVSFDSMLDTGRFIHAAVKTIDEFTVWLRDACGQTISIRYDALLFVSAPVLIGNPRASKPSFIETALDFSTVASRMTSDSSILISQTPVAYSLATALVTAFGIREIGVQVGREWERGWVHRNWRRSIARRGAHLRLTDQRWGKGMYPTSELAACMRRSDSIACIFPGLSYFPADRFSRFRSRKNTFVVDYTIKPHHGHPLVHNIITSSFVDGYYPVELRLRKVSSRKRRLSNRDVLFGFGGARSNDPGGRKMIGDFLHRGSLYDQ